VSEFPSLAEVLQDHPILDGGNGCGCGRWHAWTKDGELNGCWEEHAQDAWREACAITTVEQLDALPVGSVISLAGGIAELVDTGEGDPPEWWIDGQDQGSMGSELPALLIWHPRWAA